MNVRNSLRIFLSTVFLILIIGCGKSGSKQPSTTPASPASSPDTIARIHWLGKRRLDLDAGAYYFSRIWSLPETSRLQRQTFDRFAIGTWRLLFETNQLSTLDSQLSTAALRPLFDDLAQEEVYLEMRIATNSQTFQSCFAIHLSPRRAGIWETNLAIAAELFSGSLAVANSRTHGWTIQRTNAPNRITLTRVAEWTVVGIGPEKSPLLDEITTRILHDASPLPATLTNFWLEADVDLNRVAAALSPIRKFPAQLPSISLKVAGDGGHVITHGQLVFPESLPLQFESWHIPTNLIHEPLLGFTALRGIQSWLNNWKMWNELFISAEHSDATTGKRNEGIQPGGDQFFFWSTSGSPFQTYLAVLFPDAAEQVAALSESLLQKGNPQLAANGYIGFDRASDSNGVVWGNIPSLKPFIKSAGASPDGWLYAGLLPDSGAKTNSPLLNDIVQNLLLQTNLVYYDWENTGQQIQPRLILSQTARQITRKNQIPMDSASLNWLAILIPRLGATTTIVNRTATNQLTFSRVSTVGFTALELHLLTDWLESPQFPAGLYSTTAPSDSPTVKK